MWYAARGHWLGFFSLVMLAWGLLFAMAVPSDLRAFADVYGSEMLALICGTTPGSAGPLSAISMWVLMSGAMMAPTAFLAFRAYDDLSHACATSFFRLVSGFLAIWVGFSVVAGLLQYGLFQAGLVDALGESRSSLLSGVLLIGAGLYQFSALKEACLERCRLPLAFFMQHWQEGPWRNGLRLGVDCLGCCWALMLLGFVGGTMNMAFMGLALLLMTIEKLPDIGRYLTRPLGMLLLIAGTALVLASFASP